MTTEVLPLRPPRRDPPWIVIGLALAALIIGGVVGAILLTRDDSGTRVAVPSVIGQNVARAAGVLQRRGLAASTITSPSDTFAAGTVIAQDPGPGPKVSAGTIVILTVSGGPTTTTSTTSAPTTTTSTTSTTTSTTSTTIAPSPAT